MTLPHFASREHDTMSIVYTVVVPYPTRDVTITQHCFKRRAHQNSTQAMITLSGALTLRPERMSEINFANGLSQTFARS